MSDCDYQYILKMMRRDGSVLGEVPVATDFEPARECARFALLRKVAAGATERVMNTEVEPLWHSTSGRPHLAGFRVNVTGNQVCDHLDFPIEYWGDYARDASEHLVNRGVLRTGDVFHYSVMAVPAEARPRNGSGFCVEETSTPAAMLDSSLIGCMRVSLPTGPQCGEDFPVFIPSRVLEETEELRLRAGAAETGGVLVGYLRRDPSVPEVFAEVSGQIPAAHTSSQLTRLTFTSETWTAVRAEIDARGRNETLLGYWHSHPVKDWSNASEQSELVKGCRASRSHTGEFFSLDDCAIMRAVFWPAYSVGLVISDVSVSRNLWTSSWSLFGWRAGSVQHRGFYILDARKAAAVQAAVMGGK